MRKNEMLTLVINKFGFEHQNTIEFAEAIEWLGQVESEALLEEVLSLPLDEDEDDEEYFDTDYDECGYDPYMGCYSFDC